jgi:hypothetical protein
MSCAEKVIQNMPQTGSTLKHAEDMPCKIKVMLQNRWYYILMSHTQVAILTIENMLKK